MNTGIAAIFNSVYLQKSGYYHSAIPKKKQADF